MMFPNPTFLRNNVPSLGIMFYLILTSAYLSVAQTGSLTNGHGPGGGGGGGGGPCQFEITELVATQTGGNAGTRSSSSTLKIVTNDKGTAVLAALGKCTKPADQPTWSGDGLLNAAVGSLTANWEHNSTATIQANASGGGKSVTVELFRDEKVSKDLINADTATIKDAIDKVNKYIDKIGFKKGLTASGKVTLSSENVDFFDDGSRIGNKSELKGSAKFGIGELTASIAGPTMIPGVTWKGTASISLNEPSISGSGAWDESKAVPNQNIEVSGGIKAGIKGKAEVALGIPKLVDALTVEGTGESSVGVKVIGKLEGRDLYMSYEAEGNALAVRGAVSWTLGIDYTFAEIKHDFGNFLNYKSPKVKIYTIPSPK
jgi:hypothetical protein